MATIKRQNIGAVGYPIQGWVFLTTDEDLTTIEAPGYLNNLLKNSDVIVNPDDFIAATYSNSSGVFRASFGQNNTITLIPITASAGGGFEYADTFFVASNGDDANDGKSPVNPKQTIQNAIDSFTTPTTPSTIVILDGATYTETLAFPASSTVKLFGPSAQVLVDASTINIPAGADIYMNLWALQRINGSGNVMIAITAGSFVRADIKIIRGGSAAASALACDFGGGMRINCDILTGGIVANDLFYATIAQEWEGDLSGAQPGPKSVTLDIGKHSGNVNINGAVLTYKANEFDGVNFSMTESSPGDSSLSVDVLKVNYQTATLRSLSIANSPIGNWGNEIYGEKYILSPTQTDFTATNYFANHLVKITSTSNIELYAPDYATDPTILPGYRVSFVQLTSGNGRINVMGSDILESVSGRRWTEGRGAISTLTLIDQDVSNVRTWSWSGQIAGSSTSTFIFVSQLSGDDATATGSETQPFATIQAAITFAGTPANPTFIRVIDGEVYDEAISITQPNIHLIAPYCIIQQTGASDVITVNIPSDVPVFMIVGVVQNTGTGRALYVAGQPDVLCRGEVVVSAASSAIECVTPASTSFRGVTLSGDLDGTGSISYAATAFNGTVNNTSARGIDIDSVNSNRFSVVNRTGAGATEIEAGSRADGIEGNFIAYPPIANRGRLAIKAASNTGDFDHILTHDVMGSAKTWILSERGSGWILENKNNFSPDANINILSADATIPFSAMSGGASLSIFFATSGAQYRIREIYIHSSSTNFSGGGGDRDIEFFASTNIYTVIPAATLAAIPNARWGSADLPFPASLAINANTPTSINLAARYSGGTTDYTAGSLDLTVVYERIF